MQTNLQGQKGDKELTRDRGGMKEDQGVWEMGGGLM